jgi:hypothetical protein
MMVGFPGRLWRFARRRLTRNSLNKDEAAFLFAFLDVLEDGRQIVIEASGMGVADSTNFIDNWIIHGLISNNSSGVQMIGALLPPLAQRQPSGSTNCRVDFAMLS